MLQTYLKPLPPITLPLEVWAKQINNYIENILLNLIIDLTKGNIQFKIFPTAPTLNDLAEGEIVFTNDFMYVRVNNRLKKFREVT